MILRYMRATRSSNTCHLWKDGIYQILATQIPRRPWSRRKCVAWSWSCCGRALPVASVWCHMDGGIPCEAAWGRGVAIRGVGSYIYNYIYIYVYMYVYIYEIYTHTYVYIYITHTNIYIYIYTYTYLYIELHGFWTWVLKAMVLVENDPSTSINGWERARTKGRAIVERQLGEAQAAGELMCAAFPFGSWGISVDFSWFSFIIFIQFIKLWTNCFIGWTFSVADWCSSCAAEPFRRQLEHDNSKPHQDAWTSWTARI